MRPPLGQSKVGGDTVASQAGSNPKLGYIWHFKLLSDVNARLPKSAKQRKDPSGWYEENVPEGRALRRTAEQQQGGF